MTKAQKLATEINSLTHRVADLQSKNRTLTPEQAAEVTDLDGQLLAKQTEYSRALQAEANTPPDGETTERDRLAARADLGRIFAAVLNHSSTAGAEAELQAAYKLDGHSFPVDMLRQPPILNVLTPAPADVQGNQNQPLPAIFPRSAASFLGVAMPTVGVGESQHPVMETATVAADVAEGGTVSPRPAASRPTA